MLSICIPHFNYPNPQLFETLKSQAEQLQLNFEIIIIDDASEDLNKKYLEKYNHSPYRVKLLDKNIGRSAIRNLLAQKAKYKWLLFLDGDSIITHSNFISNYLINLEADIISGGRIYPTQLPDKKYFLHWNYGLNVESNSTANFHSNNFMIRKSVFDNIQFNEDIENYGYEDVVFGLEAKKAGLRLKNIVNPVLHSDLKTNEDFLTDVEQSLINLLAIVKMKSYLNFESEVRLINTYKKLKRVIGFLNFMKWFKSSIRDLLLTYNLKNSNRFLALYKLLYFHELVKADKNPPSF